MGPLQHVRIHLGASPWLEGAGSAEAASFVASKLEAVLKGAEVDSSMPPQIDLKCCHISEVINSCPGTVYCSSMLNSIKLKYRYNRSEPLPLSTMADKNMFPVTFPEYTLTYHLHPIPSCFPSTILTPSISLSFGRFHLNAYQDMPVFMV